MERTYINIYNDILEMSDLDMQKKLWLNKNNNTGLISSYTELICRLFDDNDFNGFIRNITLDKSYSSEIIFELTFLRDLLNKYEEKQSDEEIINDIKWKIIVNQAKVVIEKWKNFNDYFWQDAIIKNIIIDRKNPGYEDTISFDILWTYPKEEFNQIIFEDVYWVQMTLGFGVVANESILEAYVASNDDIDLINFWKKWENILDVKLNCYIIKTSSTGSVIKIIAKEFKVIEY